MGVCEGGYAALTHPALPGLLRCYSGLLYDQIRRLP
jgi:hypothetical protein